VNVSLGGCDIVVVCMRCHETSTCIRKGLINLSIKRFNQKFGSPNRFFVSKLRFIKCKSEGNLNDRCDM